MYLACALPQNNFYRLGSFVVRELEREARRAFVRVRIALNVFALALATKTVQAETPRAAHPSVAPPSVAAPGVAGVALRVERSAEARDCADEAELTRRVARINSKGEAALPAGLRIEVRFYRRERELVAQVSTTGPKPGQRTLRDVGPHCDALSGGVAVAIALLLDELEQEDSAPPPPPSTPEPRSAAPSPAEPTHDPLTPTTERWKLRLGAELGGGYGLGGAGTALGTLHVGLRRDALRLDLGASGTWPRTSGFDTGELHTSLVYGSARGCWLLGRGLPLGPCLLFGVGRLRGAGAGYGETRTANLLWTAAGLGLGAEVPLGDGFRATLGATLWLPLERHTFSVQNRGTAWESAIVAGVLSVGLEVDAL